VICISILWFSFLAGLVTGAGALIAIILKNPSDKLLSSSLGFASGIMIGISTLSLIPQSLETGTVYLCVGGFVCGALFLYLVDATLPHIHKYEADCDMYMKMGSFIAVGIALHNLPEGMAIGTTSQISMDLGLKTAFSIGIHNIAEGLAIAMPLCFGKMDKTRIVFVTTMTGLATLIGALIGVKLEQISYSFISFSLAFAAGAMIYISSDELIPHSHHVHSNTANISILAGIMLAIVLR